MASANAGKVRRVADVLHPVDALPPSAYVHAGPLVHVLEDWCPPFPGCHLYYPGRRQPSPAFALVVGALRYRGER